MLSGPRNVTLMEEPKDRERLALILPEDNAPQLLLPRSCEFLGASQRPGSWVSPGLSGCSTTFQNIIFSFFYFLS